MSKYLGPCLQCGKMNDSQYSHKLCIACYQRLRVSGGFSPRKKYGGPCVICGTHKSTTGRFIRKMCDACYRRMNDTGNRIPKKGAYPGPCVKCGAHEPGRKYFIKKMCISCYKKNTYKKAKPKECKDCHVEIGPKSRNGRCRKCQRKFRWKNDPEYREAMKRRRREYMKTPHGQLASRMHIRKRRAQRECVENTLTAEQWKSVLDRFNYRCAYCKKKRKLEMDHVIPVSKGGPHSIENVVPACRSCNSSKCDGPPPVPIQTIML